MFAARLLPLLPLTLSLASAATAADWPQFRGPAGQGLAPQSQIPASFSETENIRWSTGIPGSGWSSPVVQGNRVWLTTAVESKPTQSQIEKQFEASGLDRDKFVRRQVAGRVSLRILCLDRVSGRLLSDREFANVESPEAIHVGNSYASPTPVVEGDRLYVHFGVNGTACVDTETGEVLWRRVIPVFYSVGAGSSPVLYQNLLVLVCDGVDKQFVIAMDKHTGETAWKTSRPPFRNQDGQHRKAYSTPLVVEHEGRDQLVIPGAQWAVAYDPLTGEEIWRVDHGEGFSVVPRPVAGHGMVYFCTGYSRPELWAVRLDGRGDVTDTHVTWKEDSQIPKNSSPLLLGDVLLVVSDTGIASCFDARSGETLWKQRIGGNYSASPVAAGGRVYFFSQEGKVTSIEAGRQWQPPQVSQIDGRLMASPALTPKSMLLRSDSKLYCIGEPAAGERP